MGVDDAPSSWFGRWQLLHFFLLLVITLAAARLFGRIAGVVAGVAMALSFHEPFAPLWTWLNLLAAVALVRVAPPGRLLGVAKGYRVTSFVVLLLFLAPFAAGQMRIAVFPQLESPLHRHEHARTWGLFELLASRPPPELPVLAQSEDGPVEVSFARSRAAPDSVEPLSAQDDGALLQTGPRQAGLELAGLLAVMERPVGTDRNMRLVILSDWLVSALRIVGKG